MRFLGGLNPEQRRAVEHGTGPLLVLAGAGSGKTRVLTHRIAHLVDTGTTRADRVLAVTFTNKAAGELRLRVDRLLAGATGGLRVGTFHSICAGLLRRHISELGLGYDRSFAIYDADDQRAFFEAAIAPLALDPPAALLAARVDQAKNDARDARSLATSDDPLDIAAARAYGAYQEALRRQNALDFGDLLLLALALLERVPHVRARYQETLEHVLVDEYQDTCRAQYLLLRSLCERHRNLVAVGDEDQSIYRWRGADIRNILDFENDFPDAVVLRLEQNYRSTRSILAAADAVIRNNRERKGKTLWTENEQGPAPVLVVADDERSEARFVAEEIARLSGEHTFGDLVVFYRTNAQSRVLEEEFLRRGFPYALVGGVRFYERKEVKDVLAYLRVIANPVDDWSLKRIVNVPARGIGPATVTKLSDAATAARQPLSAAIASPPTGLTPAVRDKVLGFARTLDALRACEGGIEGLAREVLAATGIADALRAERTSDAESRLENLRELLDVAREADSEGLSLVEFLERAALVSDADLAPDARGRVTLMTLHTSKGLEFAVVFLLGMEEGLFPHRRSLAEPGAIEEERRLCYVGMTRARRRLYLIRARRRRIFGTDQQNRPSRFLAEIPASLLEVRGDENERFPGEPTIDYSESQLPDWERRRRASPRPVVARASSPVAPTARSVYRVGSRVSHPTFGVGVVRATEGSGESEKVTVAFERLGVRKLLAHVARLERV
ncbi:MAG: ATP-dependent helicase UvrD/PcrA [Candidatus Binatota bacterium]|nr:ATP-dependent helicase UvrD/PcrA [Candidatus Binatota bacterium]